VITRLTGTWNGGQRAVAQRDLSGVDYVYLWADGIHVNIHREEQKITGDLDELLACSAAPTTGAGSTRRTSLRLTRPGHASSAVS
jgi:hypothetical protein